MNAQERPTTRLWREALARFEVLLQQPPERRERMLTDIGQTQPHLHSMLVSLLEAESRADRSGFLDPPKSQYGALGPGTQLGPYRIQSQIGAGGMGEVWLATRDDGLYQGDVAIKTLHPYFGGGALRERFLHEAQILGRLTHPNIARLLDAGVSADGGVYLVLEYVQGAAIDSWSDERKLTVEARLRLFLDVCAAVAQAHANLVVHRDIKPSNILVNGNGQVKLLDFGVAKLLEAEPVAGRAELTGMTGRIFTPEYAAPEQILGEPVTTATDVYALGMLLHVLATGTRPYGNANNPVEIERAVLHDEPSLASQSDSRDAEAAAAARSTSPAKLRRDLEGDLDNIIARALRKTPGERYASVSALADDIQRHLTHQPILARPETFAARTCKFVRRHRVGVAASLLMVAALGIGIGGVIWQAQLARTEARKATAVRDFLVGIFEQNSVLHPEGARARATTAEELLTIGAERIRAEMADVPEARAEMLGTIADIYGQLELPDRSTPLYEQQLQALQGLYGNEDARTARAAVNLGLAHAYSGGYETGGKLLGDAVRVLERDPAASAAKLGSALIGLGHISYRTQREKGDALERFSAARDTFARYAPGESDHAVSYYGMAHVYEAKGDVASAIRSYREGIAVSEQIGNPIVLAGGYQQLGDVMRMQREFTTAREMLTRAVASFEKAGGSDHPFTADARKELAKFLTATGDHAAARAQFEQALAALERTRGPLDPELTADSLSELGAFYYARGDMTRAREHLERSIAASRSIEPHGMFLGSALARLVRAELYAGRIAQAQRLADEYRELVRKQNGEQHLRFGNSRVIDAELLILRGQPAAAVPIVTSVLKQWPAPDGEISTLYLVATPVLVRAAVASGDLKLAEHTARELSDRVNAFKALASALPEERAAAALRLGQTLCALDRNEAGEPLLREAVTLRESLDDPASPWLAEARNLLAECN